MGRIKNTAFVLVCFLFLQFSSAVTFNEVITNSEDWTDVYSGIHYANLVGVSSDFLTSTNHGKILSDSLNKEKNILVLSSNDKSYVFNYADTLQSAGFNSVNEISADSLNLRLIEELPDVQNFIIVDSEYGYSGIAVAPYAIKTNSWVFFANNINIEQIDSILASKNVKNILIYGYVDREVRDTLEKYSPKIINNQDKFEDNVQIVQEYLKINPTKQVLLSNGEFIEKELMLGVQPVLFTGRENVPDKIRDYLKTADIEIGVLIGNELMGAATNIRRSTGISVMVKFARGARVQSEGVSAVEGLDLFPLPAPIVKTEIYSVDYNTLSKQLEVVYKSTSNVPIYLKGTITINNDGEKSKVGDTEVVFISPGSYKTVTYPLDLNLNEGAKAQIYAIYGESKSSLDRELNAEWKIGFVNVIDRCELDVSKVSYNKQRGEFEIKISNKADVDCWTDVVIEDLAVGYEEKTIASATATKIKSGSSSTIVISQELLDKDLEKNKFVNVVLHYGQKETSLVKIFKGKYELNIIILSTITYLIAVLVLGIFVFFLLFLWKRKKEKDSGFDF